MKTNTIFHFLFLSVFFLFLSAFHPSEAHADIGKGPVQKLARGIVYIVACPFQIPKEIIQTTGEADPVWLAPWKGMTEGVGSGLYHAGRQGVSGFWDLFTFFTPAGREWGPLFEPSSFFPQV